MYDVIIIGAGPSGAFLAYLLAEKNYAVLLLEKDNLPRKKACGGGLTYKARQALPFDVSGVIDLEASQWHLEYRTKKYAKLHFTENVSSLVKRDAFDEFLVNQARAAGAQVCEGFKVIFINQETDFVSVAGANGSHTGKFLVGADGVNSLTARQVGLMANRKTGAAITAEIIVPQTILDSLGAAAIFDFGAVPYGYAWIFPKKDHLNAGVFSTNSSSAKGLKTTFARYQQKHHLLKDGEQIFMRGHSIPLGGIVQPLHKKRTLLLGDAGNLADPFLGEGLFYSFRSAQIAAEVIDRSIVEQNPHLGAYSQKIQQEIIPQLRNARYLANMVYCLPKTCTWMLSRSPYLQHSIVKLLRGEIGYTEMNHMFFLKFPYVAGEVAFNRPNSLF